MAYADLSTIQATDPGDPLTAAWCDQARDNGEFFVDPPACSVFGSSAQSVPDSSPTPLTANSESFDNDSMHSTVTNTSRLTMQTAGRYLCVATATFAADVDGFRRLTFRVDGTTSHTAVTAPVSSGSVNAGITGVRALVLNAGQYVEVLATHSAGAALDVTLVEFFAMFLTR